MGGGGNFKNFSKLGGANELEWAEKNQKFVIGHPPTFREGRVSNANFRCYCLVICVSSVNLRVLGHLIPPLWIPPPCNIRGACLGKY